MEDDQEQRPESLLPYDDWIEAAMRQVVVQAFAYAAANGLPGEHHFYLTFRTDHPGVVIPPRLRAQYPQEMTIVLQHQFWDLTMDQEAGVIGVGLSFGGVPATLVIPLDAVVAFHDPHVRYGLRLRPLGLDAGTTGPAPDPAGGDDTIAPDAEPEAGKPPAEETPAQVVSLDAFRRRSPAKE